MTATQVTATEGRTIGRCPGCRKVHVIPTSSRWVNASTVCDCGRYVPTVQISRRVSTKKCGAGCAHAQGPSCSCECGGENHGAGWVN